MAVLYLAKRSKMLGCESMLKEAINQLVLHVDKLYDETTNLFFHGYDDISEKPMGTLWGRGNTWITVATVEIMDIIGRENVPEETLNKVKAQLDALSKYQLDNGMWATVIDHPYETYEETSITAGTAYAVLHGVQRGYFEERHLHMAEKAIGALMQNISDEGSVQKGSTGTPIKENVAAYNEIAYNVTPFTQGLALMALNKKSPGT
jgi:unsaturated rhamnogalacturonyl hydrolase